MGQKKIFSKKKNLTFKKALLIWMVSLIVLGGMIFLLGKFVLSDSNGSSDVDNDLTYPPVKSYEPISFPTPGKIGNDKPSDEENSDKFQGLTNGMKYHEKLVDESSRNILFIGQDRISGLYDTIGILSIDRKNKKLKIIMIPRDLYIDYSSRVKHYLEENGRLNDPDFYKINAAHLIGPYMKYEGKFGAYSMNFLAELIKEIFDIEVHDYVRFNTEGFVQIVDLFGGVDINVPYDMHYDDIYQDLHIHINKGWNHLDGKKAEGFVRYRQSNDEMGNITHSIGDYERKKNQINFIKAFIEQHGTMSNIDKLPSLISTLNKYMKHSIGVGDVLTTYIGYAKDVVLYKYPIETYTVTGKDKYMNQRYYIVIENDNKTSKVVD
ncbi:MAG TPA: LCP family protein [Acetivibrio thermocellus]|nr:LCP family protein [Acetivibrio thermocellus]